MIMQSCIMSQFGYCPLIWINHNQSLNNNINRIPERTLRIVYGDKSIFKELLQKVHSETIHVKYLQVLVTEMYKVQNNCSPEIMHKVFTTNEPIYEYDLRKTSDFAAGRIKTVRYGLESLSNLRPRLWNILLNEYKKLQSVRDFKANSLSWVPENCPYRLCKYIYSTYRKGVDCKYLS